MIQVGPKPINVSLSWDNIASVNRRNIESKADRYFFVRDPIPLHVSDVDGEHTARLPLHPDYPERGTRNYAVKPDNGWASFVISRDDLVKASLNKKVRLMGLFNIEITDVNRNSLNASYYSKDYQEARAVDAPFIHWLPGNSGVEARVVMPDATIADGLVEPKCLDLELDAMIQFERFGFVRVDNVSPFVAYYAHR